MSLPRRSGRLGARLWLLALLGLLALLAPGPTLAADAPEPGLGPGLGDEPPVTRRAPRSERSDRLLVIECANIRRLQDNFMLDRRIRFEFRLGSPIYARFDNFGRGWHPTGRYGPISVDKAFLTLARTPRYFATIDRYTGDLYWADAEAPELSIWGRCNTAPRLMPLF